MPRTFVIAEGKRVQITNAQKKKIEQLYKDVISDMKKESEKLKGRTNVSSVLRDQYVRGVARETKEELNKLSNNTQKIIKDNMLTMSKEVVIDNQGLLKSMGFSSFYTNVAYSHVPADIVEHIMSGKLYEGKWSLSKAIWSDNKKTLSDIDSIIAKGIAENKSAYDIAKDLEKYVDPKMRKTWEWAKVYPGTKKVIDYNAQRLARTMVSHAYQESFVRTTKNNPFIEAYQWLTSNSDRVCPICIDLAESDSYGLGAGIYPKDKLPMDHPNGMCVFDSVITKNYEEIANDIRDWSRGEGNANLNKQIDKFVEDLKNN